ncbi:MAG: SCO family protein [Bdellovibrionaceae bacterium]|nr:SCO family protein [Pseudobdellovibrionaceae bacterium]
MKHKPLQQNKLSPRNSFFVFLVLCYGFCSAWAYDPTEYESQNNDLPKQIENVGITEHLGADLSKLNINLIDEDGVERPLQSFLTQQRPTLLSLVYFSCPSLCNLHLNGVLDALGKLSLVPGKDYDLLAISFDPRENYELAAAKKYNYQEKYHFPENGKGIQFLTASESAVKTLADAVGFKYKWDDKAKEWAHASAAVLLTPQGVVSRYLHGVYFEPKTLRLSIIEASKGKVGDIIDSVVLFCFRYDPKANKYALYAFNLVRAGAVAICIVMATWLFLFWRRTRQQKEELTS